MMDLTLTLAVTAVLVASGLSLTYAVAVAGCENPLAVREEGTFQYPLTGNTYHDGQQACAWKIYAPKKRYVRLEFEFAFLGYQTCTVTGDKDELHVYDGTGVSAPKVASLCGLEAQPPLVVSSGRYIYITLNKNKVWNHRPPLGFRINIQHIPEPAAGVSCDSNPCLMGASCLPARNLDGYFCACPDWLSGKNCEVAKPPSNITLLATRVGTLEATWDSPGELFRANWNHTAESARGQTGIPTHRYVISGLPPGTYHHVRLHTLTPSGEGEVSPNVGNWTQPAKPANLAAKYSPKAGLLQLSWNQTGNAHVFVVQTLEGTSRHQGDVACRTYRVQNGVPSMGCMVTLRTEADATGTQVSVLAVAGNVNGSKTTTTVTGEIMITYPSTEPTRRTDISVTLPTTTPSCVSILGDSDLVRRMLRSVMLTPNTGPVSGGTVINVTSRHDDVISRHDDVTKWNAILSMVTAVYIGSQDAKGPIIRPDGSMTFVSPSFVDAKARDVAFRICDLVINVGSFTYRPDPIIDNIYPLTTILSGGTRLTVEGENLDSASVTSLTVTAVPINSYNLGRRKRFVQTPKNTFKARCDIEPPTFSRLICKTPPTTLQEDDISRYYLYIGFVMDGVTKYRNVSQVLPGKGMLVIYTNPVLQTWDDIVDINPGSYLNIKGNSMRSGIEASDYRVRIGTGECEVQTLADNLLVCLTPGTAPSQLPKEGGLNPREHYILVGVGANLEYIVGVGRYPQPSSPLFYIIGGVIGGVLLVAVIVIIVCCCIRRRRTKPPQAFSNLGYGTHSGAEEVAGPSVTPGSKGPLPGPPPPPREPTAPPPYSPPETPGEQAHYEEIRTASDNRKGQIQGDTGEYMAFSRGQNPDDDHVYVGMRDNVNSGYMEIIHNSP